MTQVGLWGDEFVYTTGHGSKDALERHYTPDELAHFVLGLIPAGYRTVLEPHAGGGAFLRALACRAEHLNVTALDIDPQCWSVRTGRALHCDFSRFHVAVPFDIAIGNPPFSNAEDQVDHALTVAQQVVFLLPFSRTETPERAAFYDSRPLRKVWVLAERVWPGSRQIAVFWFDATWTGTTEVVFTSWRGQA